MLSNTSKYAIRAMIYLAIHAGEKKNIDIKQISASLKIPTPFLSKILQTLVKRDILISIKGPHGGFSLARDPFSITLVDVMEALEGEKVFHPCFLSLNYCEGMGEEVCPLHKKFSKICCQTKDLFKSQSIGELAEDNKKELKKIVRIQKKGKDESI